MPDLVGKNVSLAQIYPAPGAYGLNTCSNPDCRSFGVRPIDRAVFVAGQQAQGATASQMKAALARQPGLYMLRGGDAKRRRTISALLYEDNPKTWIDQRLLQCTTILHTGAICGTSFSLGSEKQVEEEVERLRRANGVLDGAACGCCGTRYLEAPDEFILNGTHKRTRDDEGQRVKTPRRPQAVRVIHKKCRGKPGARFTISVPHRRQKETKDNLGILLALNNSAGILDIQRLLGPDAAGRKIGIGRIYDRIFWLEGILLAYEQEMLRRWRKKMEARAAKGKDIVHRISHDDMVINVNWETASDNRHTQLNCSVSADATSGYVYRIDVDFDPTVEPLEMFRSSYVATPAKGLNWMKNLHRRHNLGTSNAMTLPRFFWERPTGRLFEQQFFAACAHELRVFLERLEKQHPRTTPAEEAQIEAFRDQATRELRAIETIGTGWFGFQDKSTEVRGSSKGMTTRKIYTKAAHFALLREMLPPGQIILTTEQEATIANTLAHIFREEVKDNRFTWLAMTFNKTATKPQRTSKLNRYRTEWRKFREAGLFSGRFDHRTTSKEITLAFIADKLVVATGGRNGNPQPFPSSPYQSPSFPALWIKSSAQGGGEFDKVVGFPLARAPAPATEEAALQPALTGP